MGVISTLNLAEANRLFANYQFQKIIPTSDGVMDTTYILEAEKKSYILKKYERPMDKKILKDAKLLEELSEASLNVPLLLESSGEWHLYKKLQGVKPQTIQTYHIQALARFMAALHAQTQTKKSYPLFTQNYDLKKILIFTKKHFFYYYKKLQSLQHYKPRNEGFIHGDIFKDNTVFDERKIAVFDFIDGGGGEFLFDIAVALIAFDAKKHPLFIALFIQTYNQKAPKKIAKPKLLEMMQTAAAFYALLRIEKYKNPNRAKELL